ncbi:MAG: hypothetical protein WCJ35_24275 [Planctomycetota bacterium]
MNQAELQQIVDDAIDGGAIAGYFTALCRSVQRLQESLVPIAENHKKLQWLFADDDEKPVTKPKPKQKAKNVEIPHKITDARNVAKYAKQIRDAERLAGLGGVLRDARGQPVDTTKLWEKVDGVHHPAGQSGRQTRTRPSQAEVTDCYRKAANMPGTALEKSILETAAFAANNNKWAQFLHETRLQLKSFMALPPSLQFIRGGDTNDGKAK